MTNNWRYGGDYGGYRRGERKGSSHRFFARVQMVTGTVFWVAATSDVWRKKRSSS